MAAASNVTFTYYSNWVTAAYNARIGSCHVAFGGLIVTSNRRNCDCPLASTPQEATEANNVCCLILGSPAITSGMFQSSSIHVPHHALGFLELSLALRAAHQQLRQGSRQHGMREKSSRPKANAMFTVEDTLARVHVTVHKLHGIIWSAIDQQLDSHMHLCYRSEVLMVCSRPHVASLSSTQGFVCRSGPCRGPG